jgi:alkaline phosphatase D
MLGFDDPQSPVVASEFAGTSVSSPGPNYEQFAKILLATPHVKFFDSWVRGYLTVDVSPKQMKVRRRAISKVTNADVNVATLQSFVVEAGKPVAYSE